MTGRTVEEDVLNALILFVSGFILILGVMSVAMTLTGVDTVSALFAVWTSLGNIGYGFGPLVERTGTFIDFPDRRDGDHDAVHDPGPAGPDGDPGAGAAERSGGASVSPSRRRAPSSRVPSVGQVGRGQRAPVRAACSGVDARAGARSRGDAAGGEGAKATPAGSCLPPCRRRRQAACRSPRRSHPAPGRRHRRAGPAAPAASGPARRSGRSTSSSVPKVSTGAGRRSS